jgi:hypothetical protein
VLTKIGISWIDFALVTAVEPYMDDPAIPKGVITLQRGSQIVSVTCGRFRAAINQALEQWEGNEGCANQ